MVYRIYPTKSNTISSNINCQTLNSGLAAVANLEYSGPAFENTITRHLIYFDLTELQQKINNCQINPNLLGPSGYTLNIKNASPQVPSFVEPGSLANPNYLPKQPSTSFDLIAAAINQPWDAGRGFDIDRTSYIFPQSYVPITGYSNWQSASTISAWTYPGVYSNITAQTPVSYYAQQHFDLGNEDICMNITPIVQSWLSGTVQNNGLIIAYSAAYEQISGNSLNVSSFVTQNTNSAFLPYIQVNTTQEFVDDRPNVTNNTVCSLFLYLFSGNNLTNNVSSGITVNIQSLNGSNLITGLVPTQVSTGIYEISYLFSGLTPNNYRDVWSNISIGGYDNETITQTFTVKPPQNLYTFQSPGINAYNLTVYGIEPGVILSNDNVLKVQCSLRANYSTEAPKTPYTLSYKLVMNNQAEIIPWTPVTQAYLNNNPFLFFDLDTSWLITNQTYKIYFMISEFGTNRVMPDPVDFKVINPF